MPPPGLQIYLRPRVTLIFDLLTPKVSPFVCERNVTFALMSSQMSSRSVCSNVVIHRTQTVELFADIFASSNSRGTRTVCAKLWGGENQGVPGDRAIGEGV